MDALSAEFRILVSNYVPQSALRSVDAVMYISTTYMSGQSDRRQGGPAVEVKYLNTNRGRRFFSEGTEAKMSSESPSTPVYSVGLA